MTPESFARCFPGVKDPAGWVAALSVIPVRYDITGRMRMAMFLAQCGHESEGFTRLIENLNYSADALARTWPNRYAVNPKALVKSPNDLAKSIARNPEAIGNNVYANRMGNGPDDGFLNRGHGLIQLTGADNLRSFGRSVGKTLDETREYLLTKEGAVEGACWYWKTRDINPLADAGDVVAVTKRINGGIIGLEDRKQRYDALMKQRLTF